MKEILVALFLFLLKQCDAVIYHLNESEYKVIPPINIFEEAEGCTRYCFVELEIDPGDGEPGRTIREYSEHRASHFNHLLVRRGVCASRCAGALGDCARTDLHPTLKTEVTSIFCTDQTTKNFDTWDITVATVLITFIALNVLATLLTNRSKPDNYPSKFLSCFSLQHNWSKLMKPESSSDKNKPDLKFLNGVRVLCLVAVGVTHEFLGLCTLVINDRDVEEAYVWIRYLVGLVMSVQAFFIISGFLMAYNLQKDLDSGTERSLVTVGKRILKRWLRLTPAIAASFGISTSLFRYFGKGPFFELTAEKERKECRLVWLPYSLYLGNYLDHSKCKVETWSLSADFHMTVIGIAVLVLLKGRRRVIALVLLFFVGVFSSAAHTYCQDLDAWIITSPEILSREMYGDPTFNHVYKRTHTNLSNYVLGLAAGLLVWDITKKGKKPLRYKEYRFVIPASLIGMTAVVMSNAWQYRDAPRAPLPLRTLYAATHKVLFGVFCTAAIVAFALRAEDRLRRIFSKDIFTPLARVSYAAYCFHILLLKYKSVFITQAYYNFFFLSVGTYILISSELLFGGLVYLFIEAPIQNLSQRYILDKINDKRETVPRLKSQ